MRFIVKLIFTIPTIFTTSLNASPARTTLYMTSCCGPFTGEEDLELYLYDTKKGANYSCKVEHFYVDDGLRYAVTNCNVGTSSNGYSTPLTIIAEDRMNKGGIKLKFTFGNSSNMMEVKLIRPENTMINASRYKEDNVVFYSRVLYIADSRINTSEIIGFQNTNDYISTKRTNALDFSELSFTHSSYIALSYSKAFLRIYDYENVYPYLKSGSSPSIIELPLTLSKSEGVITFTYSTKMYVKKTTLQMYPRKAVGTVMTNEFFIPSGAEEKMSNNELEIIIENFGADRSCITIPLEFYDYRSLFGLCHNSDFCIEGGIVK